MVEDIVTGEIGLGLLVMIGVTHADNAQDAEWLAAKVAGLRVFADAAGRMNRDVRDAGGAALVIPQFTLYGDARRGKRPSFDAAAPPEQARELYAFLVQRIQDAGLPCHTGRFQQTMQVELVNEGPVTILLDSSKAF